MVKYSDGLDAVAHALANTGRRQVVAELSAGPATSSELAERLGTSLPALAKQLDILQRAGLVRSSKSGRVVTHLLAPEALAPMQSWIAAARSPFPAGLDRLATHLETS